MPPLVDSFTLEDDGRFILRTEGGEGWNKVLCKEALDELEAQLRQVGMCAAKSRPARDPTKEEHHTISFAFDRKRCEVNMSATAWNGSRWAQQVQRILLEFKAKYCGPSCPGPIHKGSEGRRPERPPADE
jgi:hypothetical protein